jgi:orotate phosphoribosyltransferase
MSLSSDEILTMFKESGALLEGHFILTSGLHSAAYFQCARVFQFPWYSERLGKALAEKITGEAVNAVVSPAVGGILVGHELARHLKVRSMFTERVEGRMSFRRGFSVKPDEKVIVAEDVTTTGGSVREVIEAVRAAGGSVVGVAAVVDRSGGKAGFDVPYTSLFQMEVTNYSPEECPMCKAGSQAVKPGSRGLK